MINNYPLVDLKMARQDCLDWIKDNGYQKPSRSACIGCPYHSDAEWIDLKENSPEEFMQAVEFEKDINKRGTTYEGKVFLHRSLRPLDEVKFKNKSDKQINLFEMECQGMCGV